MALVCAEPANVTKCVSRRASESRTATLPTNEGSDEFLGCGDRKEMIRYYTGQTRAGT